MGHTDRERLHLALGITWEKLSGIFKGEVWAQTCEREEHVGMGQGGLVLIALSAEASWGLWGGRGDRANTPKLSARLPHWWHIFSLGGLSAGPALVPVLPAHPCTTGQAADRRDPPAARPMGSAFPPPPQQREFGAGPAGKVCSWLMPGPAEHLGESQLQAITCQHFAWCSPWLCWLGKFQLLLTAFFFF